MKRLLVLVSLGCACASSGEVRRLDEARLAHDRGDDAKAYGLYVDALCHDEQNLATGRALVEVWAALGKPGTVEQRLRKCKIPVHVGAYVRGLETAAQGHWDDAVSALATAESEAPTGEDRAEVAYRRGLVALERTQYDEAIEHLKRASGEDPLRVDTRLVLAQAQSRARLYAECVATLRGLVAIDVSPNDLDKARRVLRGAVRGAEDPLSDGVRAELQDLLTVSERGAVDEQHLVRVRELLNERRHPSILTVAGVLAMRAGDVANGASWLNEATAAAPLDPDPPRALGLAFFASDRSSAAIAPLREASRRDPFDIQVRGMLAETASKLGETEISLEAYKALTVLAPRQADNYLWVARLERKSGRYEAARIAAERGLQVQGDSVALLVERAAIAAQIALTATEPRARREAADRTREAVEQLLAVAPGHPGAESIKKSVEGI